MEGLPTDVEMAENGAGYGVYNDEFYESIQAPMYVDFTQPILPEPDDSPSWFCARIGCTQKHDPELDSDKVYRNFVLRVMAARSPNVRCRKIWSTEKPTNILKCPLSAPPKSSKPKLALLSCIAQKDEAKNKVTHVSSKYMSSPGVKAQGEEKVQVMERCGSNPEVEGSMKEKNKGVVKELVFSSSLKEGNQGTSTNASVADVTAEMKKLKVKRAARIVPSRYAAYFSQMPKHSSDAVEKNKQVGSTIPCKDISSKKTVAKNMIDGKEEENKPTRKVYGLRRVAEEKAPRNCSKDSDAKEVESLPLQPVKTSEKYSSDAVEKNKQVGSTIPCEDINSKKTVTKYMINGKEEENKPKGKVSGLRRTAEEKATRNYSKDSGARGVESLPLQPVKTSEKQKVDATKGRNIPMSKGGEANGTKKAVVAKRVLAGKEEEKKPAGNVYGLRRDVAKLDRNSKVEKKPSTSCVREPVFKGKESLPLLRETSTREGKTRTTSDVAVDTLTLLKGKGDNSEKEKEQPCQKIDGLKRDGLNTIVEEKSFAHDPEAEGEECITLSPVKTSTEKGKVDACDSTKDSIPLLEGDLASVRISNQAAENETKESADKENVTASDCDRNSNLTASEAEKSSKKMKEKVLALSQGEGKAKKPIIMPTNPKPFRLRTDERSILKEMNLEKRRLLQPMMPSCSAPITKIDGKNTKHENLRKFKRGHPI